MSSTPKRDLTAIQVSKLKEILATVPENGWLCVMELLNPSPGDHRLNLNILDEAEIPFARINMATDEVIYF